MVSILTLQAQGSQTSFQYLHALDNPCFQWDAFWVWQQKWKNLKWALKDVAEW